MVVVAGVVAAGVDVVAVAAVVDAAGSAAVVVVVVAVAAVVDAAGFRQRRCAWQEYARSKDQERQQSGAFPSHGRHLL